jgi:hypothetical protein
MAFPPKVALLTVQYLNDRDAPFHAKFVRRSRDAASTRKTDNGVEAFRLTCINDATACRP